MLVEITHLGPACPVHPSHLFLHNGRLLVGRSSQCQLIIQDTTVSRKHAKIVRRHKRVVLTDLQSTNGSFVNGKRINTCELQHGAHVQFGRVEFLLTAVETQAGSEETTVIWARESAADQRLDDILSSMQVGLSASQTEVFHHLARGESYKVIAQKLSLSRNTIHNHVHAIYKAFDVHSRGELQHLLNVAKAEKKADDAPANE
jgi:DNA-binding CsgD family transcriptional regulator